jgi:DNA helicase-2/ATP-dependent DNA helicase PcrA
VNHLVPEYLAHLNPRQKEAVLALEGPVSVLAGAGSGKTSVLTTRIYHLIRQGVPAEKILAVTFTNKAAREMRERLTHRLPDSPLPFVATFHGLGRELLQTYGGAMGIPRYFTIYDRDDSKSAIREALKALDVDPKEVPPGAILARISKAKSEGVTLQEFRERFSRESFKSRIVAEAWIRYEETLKKEKSLDFDDLIVLPVRLLRDHADVREQVQQRFSYLHVDEFQDTNELQAKLAKLIAGPGQNIFVVGDIDQCLVQGTQITMSDGSYKNIEAIRKGDMVLSNYGSGDFRPALVTHAHHATTQEVIRITTTSGNIIESTPEHTHFAGYVLGTTPQQFYTYLMHKKGYGWRIGVSQTYTNGQRASMIGFQQRCNQEHGDEVWVVGTFASQKEARVEEFKLSLRYGIPTIPFVARASKTKGVYVHDQSVIDAIFTELDTDSPARELLSDKHLSVTHPHHRAHAIRSDRRNIVITLCGDHRGTTPMHRISIVGSDAEGMDILKEAGYSVRPAKAGSNSWRYESAYADFGALRERALELLRLFPNAQLIETARLGRQNESVRGKNSLSFTPAASVAPGMVMWNRNGEYELVQEVERLQTDTEVYDLNIEKTHNFIANGLITHNSIYTWRGATIENLLRFEEVYPRAQHIVLEHNYRSTKTIVDAANMVIEKNHNRKEKHAVTDNGQGERITIHPARTAEEEARWIAHEAARCLRKGVPAEQIAVLYRTNAQSRALEEAFLHAGVAYKLLGTRFYDRKEVKDVLAWVRLALDPGRESDRMRAVQAPSRGIGKVTLGKLLAGKKDELRAADRAKVEAFESVLRGLSEMAQTATPSAFVKFVIQNSGLESALLKEGEEGQERLENARELGALASRYDATPGVEGICSFLADAALAGDQDEIDRPQEGKPATPGVTLMTIHAAKGLEFDVVFVTGLEEGLFPHEGMSDEERDEEEERRLFYVAITRARKRLILTLARIRRIYGTDYLSEPSQFLRDIDPSLIEYDEADEYGAENIIEA